MYKLCTLIIDLHSHALGNAHPFSSSTYKLCTLILNLHSHALGTESTFRTHSEVTHAVNHI